MDKGTIPINKNYMLEYRYHDKDPTFKYFNRMFEVYLLEKKAVRPKYLLHMDNGDTRQMSPSVYKASHGKKKFDFGVTTLNWNDIKTTFLDYIIDEIGETHREKAKKAVGKLSSPKL